MRLLAPEHLAWLGLLAPLIALYILRRRREDRVVASTLLWEMALRDLRAEKPFQKLVPRFSLLLQILIVILGAIALARPVGAGGVEIHSRVAIVIDTSVSMAATSVRLDDATRLDEAKESAAAIIETLPPGAEAMIVEASAVSNVAVPWTRDRTELEAGLRSLAATGVDTDLEAAIDLAAERLRDAPDGSRVLVFTDGAFDGTVSIDRSQVEIDVRRVGGDVANSAIVGLDLRPRPTDESPDRTDAFVRVQHNGLRAADLFVTAETEAEGVLASRRVSVEAGSVQSVVLSLDLPPDAEGRASVVTVRLAEGDAAANSDADFDGLALDNVAVAPSPGARRLPVFFVGPPPNSVRRVFEADPDTELFETTLRALDAREQQAPLDGLVVYTGEVPNIAPPGDSVVIAPGAGPVFELNLGESVSAPRAVAWAEDHALLRFVSFNDVHFSSVHPIEGGSAEALLTTDAGVAIGLVERLSGQTLVLALDPKDSDWTSRESFVVFFRNVIEAARSRRRNGGVEPGTLGLPLNVIAPEGTAVEVTTPDGQKIEATVRNGAAVVPIGILPGAYRVSTENRELFGLRSLLSASESDLGFRAEITEGGEVVAGAAQAPETPSEIYRWFILGLLVILMLEIFWATRKESV